MSAAPDELPPEATVAAKLSTYVRAGGIVTPLITVVFAFLVAGLVVLITGHNPFSTYRAIFDGTGLNWLFPWSGDRSVSAINLQQTLIATTPLILCGLAVAFAFRCGLFNIGGQGQYQMGAIAAVWVGSSFASMAGVPHVVLAILAACLAVAVWAGIAGLGRISRPRPATGSLREDGAGHPGARPHRAALCTTDPVSRFARRAKAFQVPAGKSSVLQPAAGIQLQPALQCVIKVKSSRLLESKPRPAVCRDVTTS